MKKLNFYKRLANYFPSFMSRYYIQLLLISTPWILQKSKINLTEISLTFSVFFIGSLMSTFVFSMIINKLNIVNWMRISIIVQAITIALCFIEVNLGVLILLRFIQGVVSGLFRPLNRIWLQETLAKDATPNEHSRVASIGQSFIALGMSGGALAGVAITYFYHNHIFLSLVVFLPAILAITPLLNSKFPETYKEYNDATFKDLIGFFLKSKDSLIALIAYIISLVVFKIWIVGVPYYFRANLPSYDSVVMIFLILQALAYALAQFIIGNFTSSFPNNKNIILYLMLITTILQGIITWLTLYFTQKIILYLLIIIGGGVIPAAIFPLFMMVLMSDLHIENSSLRKLVFFALSISADIGQLLGSLLLIFPNIFKINFGVIFIPIAFCFALGLYIKITSLLLRIK
jgi:Na+/melibiose symporter-like transporter